jgi:hypothetical protein
MGRQASAGRASRTASFERIPLGRQGTAWEVAEAVTFLLSDRASYIDVLLDAGPYETEMLGHQAFDPVGAADRLDEEHQQRARP